MPETLRGVLQSHRGARVLRSVAQLATTGGLFALCWWCMWLSLSIGYWLSLLLAIPTAGMLVRLFILQHDCGHGSLFAQRWANRLVGVTLSCATLTPFQCWRRQHAQHHATNGQLDHRGTGDVDMLTLEEYRALNPWQRLRYRCYRHPLVLFGVGPILYFGILQRLPWRIPRTWKRERLSIHGTNLLLLATFSAAAWAVGPVQFLQLHLPVLTLAASAGSWLFFVQHQFDPTYWRRDKEWDHQAAAMAGSSFLDLPLVLRWLTANIGYHHVHHLDSRIPNYSLADCHEAHEGLRVVQRLTLSSAIGCVRLKMWDEASQKLISFRQANEQLG
jgi:omega-6 fatty acid desaturase (delta-12 desaturase)